MTRVRLFDAVSEVIFPAAHQHTFRGMCGAFNIPFPDTATERELDHFKHCLTCRQLWPMFVYFHHLVLSPEHRCIETCVREWSSLPEHVRVQKHIQYRKKINKLVLSLCKPGDAITAFNMYLKEMGPVLEAEGNSRTRVLTMCRQRWRNMDEETRKHYNQLQSEARQERREHLRSLPKLIKMCVRCGTHMRREVSQSLCPSSISASSASSAPPAPPAPRATAAAAAASAAAAMADSPSHQVKRPSNAFVIFMSKMYHQSKNTTEPDLSYREAMCRYANMWHGMTAEEKQPYVKEAASKKRAYDQQVEAVTGNLPSPPRKRSRRNRSPPSDCEDNA